MQILRDFFVQQSNFVIKESLRAMRKAYIPGMTCVGTPYLPRETGDGFENERLVKGWREEGAAGSGTERRVGEGAG